MRNQKLQIIALVIAIVGLGIGFAAFSNTLTVSQSATVTPDSSNFKVVFTKTSGTEDTNPIVPVKSVNTITATDGTIDQTNKLTLTNLGVTFTEPGQYVEYDLYVYNAGAYIAHLNSVTFRGTKSCTPTDNTVNYVDEACNGISMTVKVGNAQPYTATTQNITGQSLNPGASTPVKIRIEYASNGARADGAFRVSFPDVSLYYMTVSGTNEQYTSTFTGTIYRHTNEIINNGVSITEPWCVVVSSMGLNSCVYNNYANMSFNSELECQAAIDSMGSNPDATAEQKQLAQVATCEQGTPLSYETSSNNIDSPIYLKHDVSNDIVTASYSCIKYTEGGINKEACVRGGDGGSSYGTFDGISSYDGNDGNYLRDVSTLNPTGNIAVIQSTHDYFYGNSEYCNFYDSTSACYNSSLILAAHSDGYVGASDFDASENCNVFTGGGSKCN